MVRTPVQGEEGSGEEGGSGDGGTPGGECPVQFMFRNVYCQDGGEVLDDALCQEPDPEDGSPMAGDKPNVFKSCQEGSSDGTDELDEPQVVTLYLQQRSLILNTASLSFLDFGQHYD